MDAAHDYERGSAWRRHAAELIQQASTNRARAAQVAFGEAVPGEPGFLKDTLTIPDLAALDASVQRTNLLMNQGIDALALALDAVNSAAAQDPVEKMHIHQLAVLHKIALEQMGQAHFTTDPDLQAKQFQTANRFIRSFQQGLVTLTRLRGGSIPIVQHVHINDGAQAVVGTMQNSPSAKTAPARVSNSEPIN